MNPQPTKNPNAVALGRLGGRAGRGPSKARTTEQARAAVAVRWSWRMTDEKDGHKWGFWKDDPYQCCRICGLIRRADDQNAPCQGKPKLRL